MKDNQIMGRKKCGTLYQIQFMNIHLQHFMLICIYHFTCHQVAQIIYFIKHIHLQNHTIA